MDINIDYVHRAILIALDAEQKGNLPIGAVIVLNDDVVAEAGNSILAPQYHPGRHAEMEALRAVPVDLWPRSREMACYTTLEPCLMCFGALLLHGIGKVVFGARDTEGGATAVLDNLPPYYADLVSVPELVGPVLSKECEPLFERVKVGFDRLPCGRHGSQNPNARGT
jgi:tRNA(adenine34) deaminase